MYEFRVDGRLPEHSREAFCGMLVEEIPPGAVLRDAVIDEPHLLGIIDQLRVLGVSLVSADVPGPCGEADGNAASACRHAQGRAPARPAQGSQRANHDG
jgi:hypothetical protein